MCRLDKDKLLHIETGCLAMQADGSVIVKSEETILLVTCCFSKEIKQGIDFFPLTVDFEEKMYSIGKIPSSYMRREAKPLDKAILAGRLVDRSIRPLFPKDFYNDVQINVSVLSFDQKNPPETLAILGASAAINLAGLPAQPIAAVRVGLIENRFVINPTYSELKHSSLDLIVSGNEDNILMVEAGANFIEEDVMLAAIDFAQPFIKKQIKTQEELFEQCNISKINFQALEKDSEIQKLVEEITKNKLLESIESKLTDKKQREGIVQEAYTAVKEYFKNSTDENKEEKLNKAIAYTNDLEKALMRKQIIEKGERVDGRKCNEIRPIWSKTSLLPRTHGSAVFTRGSTQVLSVVTLGSESDAKPIDGIWIEKEQPYFHNYNFPAFSVGEARGARTPGRREIGHGALAERAIIPTLPNKEDFPYTIRVVSEVLSSNGSTSMASTCASCLALMDAGVPVKEIVGGIAMGLIIEGSDCAILSDIQGLEDFLGDMDFKVTGSTTGITALQMDLKLSQGISLKLLKIALDQALEGRKHIVSKMKEELTEAREELSKYAPRILTLTIDSSEIGALIGPGGKTIKRLIESTGITKIDVSDEGIVNIFGVDDTVSKAEEKIKLLTTKIEEGLEYKGVVVRKIEIGILVEITPGKVGLFRTSSMQMNNRMGGGNRRFGSRPPQNRDNVENTERKDISADFNIGDEVIIKVRGIDNKGRINLDSIRHANTIIATQTTEIPLESSHA